MISRRAICEDLTEVTTKSDRRLQEKLYLSRNLKPQRVPSKIIKSTFQKILKEGQISHLFYQASFNLTSK